MLANLMPAMPGWDGLHPLVIHFPIALLMTAPILLVLGLVAPRQRVGLLASAFLLMLLGTVGAYVAVETGEAGAQLVDTTTDPALADAIDRHQALADNVRWIFTVLTILCGLLLVVPMLFRQPQDNRRFALLGVPLLILYGAALAVLINAAAAGGELVHRYGIHALLPAP
jgi:uncharacterized membrane protein